MIREEEYNEIIGAFGTPLHHACRMRRVDAARVLLEHGADPNARFKARMGTPLCAALQYDPSYIDNNVLVALLLSHGALPDAETVDAALSVGNVAALRLLLPLVPVAVDDIISRMSRSARDYDNSDYAPSADFVNEHYGRGPPSPEDDALAEETDGRAYAAYRAAAIVKPTGLKLHPYIACMIAKLDDPSTPTFTRWSQLVQLLLRQQRENRALRRAVAALERVTQHKGAFSSSGALPSPSKDCD
jgi:hypothetical protein